ncbi:MAG: OmpA family protein [Geobacteraceae bacterium]|nr:OmpA family protein [Geobacteraceae bacterium]
MKKFLIPLLFALLVSLVASQPLLAGERAGAVSLSPYIGGYMFDGAQSLRAAPVFGLRLGYDFTNNFEAEGVLNFVPTKSTRGYGSVNAWSYRLDLLYNFMPSEKLVPYLALGGGATQVKYHNTNHTQYSPTANIGGGLKYFITDSIALRADVRQLFIFNGNEAGEYVVPLNARIPVFQQRESDLMFNWEASLGATFLFGPAEKPAPPVCPPPPPPPAPEPAPPVCPPPAPKPEPVPEKICMTLKIEFDFDKSDIKPKYDAVIGKVAEFLKKYPKTTSVIEGHTDNRGSYKYNIKLSERRADSVRNYLIENFGIESERLSTKGYGYTKPIASNKTAEGRQKNRRVDAIIDCIIYTDKTQ